ncbi:mg2+ transporter zinc transport protein [Diplodia corticola]|uniref:Mg2+ transporter zinc transport protein n=1 Tax=Diplodia corticola TaxID=236234 RepID=A0A1J9RV33_9PEZI|nr:mg2+ transporter zinc transport protein [Diplodia corticola]OJD31357.1 mg2+ transporter zinc transport protein [Diplodia corticola]
MALQLDNGVSAKQVADMGAKVVSGWYGYCSDDDNSLKDKLVMAIWEKTTVISFAINFLNDFFSNPATAELWKDEAFTTTKELVEACWRLYSELNTCLERAKDEKPPWPFRHMSVEEICAKVDCLHSALVLLRFLLEKASQRGKGTLDAQELRAVQHRLDDVAAGIAEYEKVLVGDLSSYSPVEQRSSCCLYFDHMVRSPREARMTMETVEICLPQTEHPSETVNQSPGLETPKEERPMSPVPAEDDDVASLPSSELDKCIIYLEELLQQLKVVQKSGDLDSPHDFAAEYTQTRKALDNLILGERQPKPPPSRRQSFQMTPVKAYLRRAKYSWKDWLLLGPIMKPKKESLTIAELHEGDQCPFPSCGAHLTPSNEAAPSDAKEELEQCNEKRVFKIPGYMTNDTATAPGEDGTPSSRLLSPAPDRPATLSFTTIYTEDDDSSSCHSCSSNESASSFCVVGEGSSKGQSPALGKGALPSAAQMPWALPECIRSMPKTANDALHRWTTLLE